MKVHARVAPVLALTGALLLGGAAVAAAQQQILLDRPVRAGELIAFPAVGNANEYYYVVDKPHLATGADGRPQFSFLRWVRNVRTGAGEAEAREGEGGGIVHALVSLSVSREQLREAERGLQRVRAGARLVGPVLFKSGKFGLVTSFNDPAGGLVTRVVGVGNAPLLDGEKAAVSLLLTKDGANILWQSFQTPTPDISFTFEMDVEGYLSPKQAKIEADFDQIYDHQAFGVGLASTYLAAEIRGAFDDLRRTGAIRLVQIGDDEDLEALVTTAYNKIAEIMFQPVNGTGSPDLASLSSAAGGQQGLLDRATTMLQRSREDARAENERRRARNRERRTERTAAGGGADATARATAAEERARTLEQRASAAEARVAPLRERAGRATGSDATLLQELVRGAEEHARTLRELAQEARAEATRLRETAAGGGREAGGEEDEEMVDPPSFAVVACYEMKRVHQSGRFTIDLNKYTTSSITLRFDENIGNLSGLFGDAGHFRQVNLDDPLFRQREIVALVDGLNAQDFGQYVNFVTVQMRKRHSGGAETFDEVRIDRNNFNREGTAFKLLYGWNGDRDDDRRAWLDYDVRSQWSFFGGSEVEVPWRRANAGAINLAPPYQRRAVAVEADPERIRQAGVRAVTVKLYYRLGAAEKVQQVTLNAANGQLSERFEFMLPADRWDYEYEVTWRLADNRTLSSGRQVASEALLFVDGVPTT